MQRDESAYIKHILDAIARVELYLNDLDEKAFQQRGIVQDAVVRQLEIIGEIVKRLSMELRSHHSQVPWQDIARMGDELIHNCFQVDLAEVWGIATKQIPLLKKEAEIILKGLD